MRISDWSSDVCSSDLHGVAHRQAGEHEGIAAIGAQVLDARAQPQVRLRLLGLLELPHRSLDVVQQPAQRIGHRRVDGDVAALVVLLHGRSEEHTSELQSLMRISYAVFCLKKKKR